MIDMVSQEDLQSFRVKFNELAEDNRDPIDEYMFKCDSPSEFGMSSTLISRAFTDPTHSLCLRKSEAAARAAADDRAAQDLYVSAPD